MNVLVIGAAGYVGSYLMSDDCALFTGYNLKGLDISCLSQGSLSIDYRKLSKEFLRDYDVVLLLAGHSSVRQCEGDMISSFQNNVANFVDLLDKLEDQKFIYASSSSVYGSILAEGETASESRDDYVPVNYYDLSKYVIDQYAKLSGKRCYGLRLGTVNGYSPILRADLMINAMTIHAAESGKVRVFDGHIHRPILGIHDLARALAAVIDGDGPAGIYNLASFNRTVSEIAAEIASCMNCEVIEERPETANASKSYDFKIDSSKFCTAYSFEFRETVKSIVDSLAGKEYQKVSRHNKFNYR